MRRRTFDFLATCIGAVLTVVLLVAGGLLMWGSAYTSSYVHNQLSEQQVYFPQPSAFAHPVAGTEITPSMIPSVSQYAGQQLTTAAQAEVYANDFIAVHLREIGGGKTYSQLSGELMVMSPSNPRFVALSQQVDTVFKGTTLRSMLLEAYGFGTFGTIAFWGGVASFILAGVFFLLSLLGFLHFRKEKDEEPLLTESETAPMDRELVHA
jgi:hypothetical protein